MDESRHQPEPDPRMELFLPRRQAALGLSRQPVDVHSAPVPSPGIVCAAPESFAVFDAEVNLLGAPVVFSVEKPRHLEPALDSFGPKLFPRLERRRFLTRGELTVPLGFSLPRFIRRPGLPAGQLVGHRSERSSGEIPA